MLLYCRLIYFHASQSVAYLAAAQLRSVSSRTEQTQAGLSYYAYGDVLSLCPLKLCINPGLEQADNKKGKQGSSFAVIR